jgi:hypothetical protein
MNPVIYANLHRNGRYCRQRVNRSNAITSDFSSAAGVHARCDESGPDELIDISGMHEEVLSDLW